MVDEVHCGYETDENKTSGDIWDDYKALVKKKSYPLWSKMEAAKLLGHENNCLTIGFHKDRYFLLDDADKDRLTEISKEYFGRDTAVKVEPLELESGSGNNHKQNSAANGNNGMNDIKREALNHPILQKVLDVFEGAVVREVITRANQDK
jgi:DNA polymerase-3 subunit gamma/tau